MKSVTTDDFELAKKYFQTVRYNQVGIHSKIKSERVLKDDPPKEWEESYENAEKYFDQLSTMSALATANVALNFKSQNPQSLFVREVRKAKVKAK